jgi:predicted ATPase
MLMNNLSTSIAQTVPDPALGTPTSKSALLSNATAWAEKALAVASEVKADERTEECDQCRAVATYNLGEFAEMEGLWEKARSHYTRASSLAKAVGYTEGRQRADQALHRIEEGRG